MEAVSSVGLSILHSQLPHPLLSAGRWQAASETGAELPSRLYAHDACRVFTAHQRLLVVVTGGQPLLAAS
jgi:hypothetical protein